MVLSQTFWDPRLKKEQMPGETPLKRELLLRRLTERLLDKKAARTGRPPSLWMQATERRLAVAFSSLEVPFIREL